MPTKAPAFNIFSVQAWGDKDVRVLFGARGHPHASEIVVFLGLDCLISRKNNFGMETDKGPTPSAGATMDVTDNTDSFTAVKSKRCQKRKLEQDGVDMDTQTVKTKRPQFPPISGDELKVNTACKRFVANVFNKNFV